MDLASQLEQVFAERERIADEILTNKQAVIDYDRRRNSNREGLRQFKHLLTDKKAWINMGNMFIKLPVEDAKKHIEREQNELSEKIDTARATIKNKTQVLEKMEGKDRLKGFDLKAISSDDLYGITRK